MTEGEKPIKLSLEQQFTIRSFDSKVDLMSGEQAKSFLKMLHEQMVIRDTYYKEILKHQWGVGE
ncbi:hypothetical protein PCC6912_50760 [Chlorogloeopsis fritschii PCC 6912]|uniref:Phycobilisome degradation protein NblA n=1 Tax=Chlorogloeopsis fritschii PCC 6912 TaxID=211165 RepID=A0A433N1L2_CHLFR|nr:NblA/ycf18 family protein [Chlorogloeopsis fritschii]RUR74898.1 hypothetical protein PCC6912_50760 [Chlorogloeopsis fritschii PCC 6912]